MRVNRAGLADIFGVTENTITNWLGQGMPRAKRAVVRGQSDEYDTAECIKWRIAREAGGNAVGDDGEVINFEAERARLTKEQADKVAMDNAVKRGDLMSATEVARHWGGLIVNAKTRLLSIPTKSAPLVLGAKSLPVAREIIERFVIEALNELVSADFHPTGSGEVGMVAASEADGQPVGGPASQVKPRGKRRARAVGD